MDTIMGRATTVGGRTWRLGVACLTTIGACRGAEARMSELRTAVVARSDIAASVVGTGVVEPIDVVLVKSKASGIIRTVPVDVGSLVRPGDLLAQIDTRDLKNAFDQAKADYDVAATAFRVQQVEQARTDDLFLARVITAAEHDSAASRLAQARAVLESDKANLELAQQRLDDATVRAPSAGTILARAVSPGMVVAAATGSFGRDTMLFSLADLSRVRMRARVNETDIARVRIGASADIAMDAYSRRVFHGEVEKIEPQAMVDQSVTMFLVSVSIANEDRLLMPGMSGEVSILVQRRDSVPAIPLDAIRSGRELMIYASALGIPPDSLRRAPLGFFTVVLKGPIAEVRALRLGAESQDAAEVLAGVADGDTVVVLDASPARDSTALHGRRVRIVMGP